MNQFQQFARPLPPGCCAIGRPTVTSSGRAAASTFDHQKTTHRGHGACRNRDGASRRDALFPADHRRTGRRFAGLGCFSGFLPLFDLPDYHLAGAFIGSGPFGQFSGIGRRANVPVANLIHHRRQRGFQAFAERLPSHFLSLSSCSSNASNIAQKQGQGLGKARRELVKVRQGRTSND